MDHLKKFLASDDSAIILAIDATETCNESMHKTGAWPGAMIHLGHAMMGAILVQSITDKTDQHKLSLEWQNQGPYGNLYAECNQMGHVRATVTKPKAKVDDLRTPLGAGNLVVRRISKQSHSGIVDAQGTVCNDILNYLHQSEQRSCAMNLWVDIQWDDSNPNSPFRVNRAIGYLVEVLASSSNEQTEKSHQQWEAYLSSLGSMAQWDCPDLSVNGIAKMLDLKAKEVLFQKVEFRCNCNRERAERALAIAKNAEQKLDLEEEENLPNLEAKLEQLRCEFCGTTYRI